MSGKKDAKPPMQLLHTGADNFERIVEFTPAHDCIRGIDYWPALLKSPNVLTTERKSSDQYL